MEFDVEGDHLETREGKEMKQEIPLNEIVQYGGLHACLSTRENSRGQNEFSTNKRRAIEGVRCLNSLISSGWEVIDVVPRMFNFEGLEGGRVVWW